MPQRVLGVIPARFASARFPGKALARIAGKTMLEHVFERASQARYLSAVVIATDDRAIYEEARRFHAPVRMTRSDHLSGTDRVAEVASTDQAEWIVNIQGDEPLIDPAAIDAALLGAIHGDNVAMGTLCKRIDNPSELQNPNVVKVISDHFGKAIYFSRLPVPYVRGSEPDFAHAVHYKHIGLYVYRREFLLQYPDLRPGPLERAERLEQLRALENGFSIQVTETEYDAFGVDTPEDLERVCQLWERNMANGPSPHHG